MFTMSTTSPSLAALLSASLLAAGALAAGPEGYESCVDSAAIEFGADQHALLDAADTKAVFHAIDVKYPKIAQDGYEPSGLVLWKKPSIGWVYVLLLANPKKKDEVCFTSTFAADKFELTKAMQKKYFGVGTVKV